MINAHLMPVDVTVHHPKSGIRFRKSDYCGVIVHRKKLEIINQWQDLMRIAEKSTKAVCHLIERGVYLWTDLWKNWRPQWWYLSISDRRCSLGIQSHRRDLSSPGLLPSRTYGVREHESDALLSRSYRSVARSPSVQSNKWVARNAEGFCLLSSFSWPVRESSLEKYD